MQVFEQIILLYSLRLRLALTERKKTRFALVKGSMFAVPVLNLGGYEY